MEEEIPSLCFAGEPLLPDRDSYQLPLASGAIGTDLPGGPMRVRQNRLNNSVNVTVSYTLNQIQTQYWMDLYYGVLLEGALPIRVRLDLTGTDLLDEVWYVATIVPGSASFPQYTAIVNTITVTYNAVPQIDRCVMQSRILLAESFGGYPVGIETILSPFARFLS